jgi:chemotaxis protein MotB
VRILQIIAGELAPLENEVLLEGHTDRRPYADGTRYGNWELSADRANAARRVMQRAGLREDKVRGVRGYADTQLRLADRPFDPRNRRVSIVVRSHAAAALDAAVKANQPAPRVAADPASNAGPPQGPQPAPGRPTPPHH